MGWIDDQSAGSPVTVDLNFTSPLPQTAPSPAISIVRCIRCNVELGRLINSYAAALTLYRKLLPLFTSYSNLPPPSSTSFYQFTMPVYQVFTTSSAPLAEYAGSNMDLKMNAYLSNCITERHGTILKSLSSEVVVIFHAPTIIYRGSKEDKHHVRVLGTIARGRSRELKRDFMAAVIADMQSWIDDCSEDKKATFAITLTECEPEDVARCVGPECSAADKEWAKSIPPPR